jgi:glyceraldehyde-3-phosphate dehydrogenase (NADP+)
LKILFVHEAVVDAFIEKFQSQARQPQTGHALGSEGVSLTPLPEARQDWITSPDWWPMLSANGAQGGQCRMAVEAVRNSFFYPAVLYPVTRQMRVYHEEQFGPSCRVVVYRDLDTVIDYVLESDFGQQLSIFGTDPRKSGAWSMRSPTRWAHQYQRPVPARPGHLPVQWPQELGRRHVVGA